MCCGYMIKKLDCDVEMAILEFEAARGHKIETTRNPILKLKKRKERKT